MYEDARFDAQSAKAVSNVIVEKTVGIFKVSLHEPFGSQKLI